MKRYFKIIIISIIVVLVIFVFVANSNMNKTKEVVKPVDDSVSLDLFGDYYDEADIVVNKMSLEEKIGQLFLVRYDSNLVLEEIKNYYPAGYIFFAKDFQNEDKTSFSTKIKSYQEKSKTPLLIAVDEEGGYVTRVSRFSNFRSEKFLSPRKYYDEGGYELLRKMEIEKGELLLSLGINLNLAPVADISTDSNDYIYNRSFQSDADHTSEFIKNMVLYAREVGISSCLKHFPGYGNNIDTHTGIAIDKRSYEEFLNKDFLPFKSGIEKEVPTILMSHNIVNSIDSKYPASLSKKMNKELRNTLLFSGVIITDDLAMDAVKSYVEDSNASTLAINAGNDLIITSDFSTMYNEVLENVKNKKISVKTIDKAVRRVIAWKYAYGLF